MKAQTISQRESTKSDLEVGTIYIMGTASSVFLYTGKIRNPERKINEHEFLLLPLYMEIPPTKPTPYLVHLLEEGTVRMICGHPYISSSKFRTLTHNPDTPDHQRLNKLLAKYPKPQPPKTLK